MKKTEQLNFCERAHYSSHATGRDQAKRLGLIELGSRGDHKYAVGSTGRVYRCYHAGDGLWYEPDGQGGWLLAPGREVLTGVIARILGPDVDASSVLSVVERNLGRVVAVGDAAWLLHSAKHLICSGFRELES